MKTTTKYERTFNSNKKYNAGQLFEFYVAEWLKERHADVTVRHDGRSGRTDIFVGNKRVEVKAFHTFVDKKTWKVQQSAAHGYAFNREESIFDQLKRKVSGIDMLVYGVGNFEDGWEMHTLTTRKEIYDFLAVRVSCKGKENEVRFCWGGDRPERTLNTRLNTLVKNGWKV